MARPVSFSGMRIHHCLGNLGYAGTMSALNRITLDEMPAPSGHRRVLVVDDSRAQRMMLAIQLRRAGYEVMEADGAETALRLCREARPNFILSDWVMPGMTGPALCHQIRSDGVDDYVYFILLTSKADPSDIAFGLESGADDFLTKPTSASELLARLRAGERILALQDDARSANARLSETLAALRSAQKAMDRDLDEARRLQQGLIGDRDGRFGDYTVSNLLRPAGHIGGDLTGSFAINSHQFGVFAIDVSGHGVAAALLTARLATQFSASVDQNAALYINELGLFESRPPAVLARYLNHLMLTDLHTDAYFTMVYAAIDRETGEARMVQAGHPHPILQRAHGGIEQLGHGGMPIGMLETATYEEFSFRIEPGDRLLIASDGVWDAADGAGRVPGGDGLSTILQSNRDTTGVGLVESMVWSILAHSGGEQADDMSAVLVERAATPE
ncbi:PP2C family protein-serine/threonine phosphatase [Paracoccus sediminicola]|uniref:PP2C family protein-serine/threonine phosphatase n=1 Tax=Paracoccus sediminicola TaxID=3017783 RepID=UPI0022F123D7|nr:fused response regulator/phosphatase [Paracoccus sediminicola]WBU56486.1 fused response regulator/phosphatase [Paracoccus sediminicola]